MDTITNHVLKVFLIIISMGLFTPHVFAWHDNTHLAIAKAAGYSGWYNATGADMAKLKADEERYNHYCNVPTGAVVDAAMVREQKKLYNQKYDPRGHLYGAILGALEDYRNMTVAGKYAAYHLAFAAHYLGDLSQPLHNVPYDTFNRTHHKSFDGIVDDEVLANLDRITENMQPIDLGDNPWEFGLPREVARVANLARTLDKKVRKESHLITEDEAYQQLGLSASLLKAVILAVGEKPQKKDR